MFQAHIISSVKQINYRQYVLLALLIVLTSDTAEPCRGGRIIGKNNLFAGFVNLAHYFHA